MKKIKLYPSPVFQRAYDKLSGSQQDFLKILSIIYEKVSRTILRKCMDRAGLKNKKGKNYKQAELKPLIKVLSKKGLIVADTKGLNCKPDYVEYLTCQAVFDGCFEKMALAVEAVISTKAEWGFDHSYENYAQAIRDVRFALYRGKQRQTVVKYVNYAIPYSRNQDKDYEDPLFQILTNPVNKSLLLYLKPVVADFSFTSLLISSVFAMTPSTEIFTVFLEARKKTASLRELTKPSLMFQNLMRGDFLQLKALTEKQHNVSELTYSAFVHLMEGDVQQAIAVYETALDVLARNMPRSKVYLVNFVGIFYVVGLMAEGSHSSLKKGGVYLNRLLKDKKKYLFGDIVNDLKQILLGLQGQKGKAEKIHHTSGDGFYSDYLTIFFSYLTLYWQGEEINKDGMNLMQSLLNVSKKAGYYWIALQTAGFLAQATGDEKYKKEVAGLSKECTHSRLVIDFIKPQEKWHQVLHALINLDSQKSGGKGIATKQSRLVWLIELYDDLYTQEDSEVDVEFNVSYELTIAPRLQTMGKSGTWSKGRAVALKKLQKRQKVDYLGEEDIPLCNAIKTEYESSGYYYGRKKVYVFDLKKAVPALIGHPRLFSEKNPSVHMEFVAREPELHVMENKAGYTMSLEPEMDSTESYRLIPETLTRIGVIQMSAGFKRVAEIIDSTITVPASAREMVLQVISTIAPHLAVHTDIAGAAPDVEEVKADSAPYIHLVPYENGLQAESLVKPFKDSSVFQRPGKGGKLVLAEIDGKKFQAQRHFQVELEKANVIIDKCPTLSRLDDGMGEWIIEDPEECLELIWQLQELQDEVIIEWPQGETLRVSATVETSAFQVRIKKDNDWFGATGGLQVDAKNIIDMGKLLTLSRQTSSRFIKMDDGQFLALTGDLKRRIEELDSFSEDSGDGVRFSPLASLALDDFVSEMGQVKGDVHWRKNQKRFTEIVTPQIPSTFRAEFRDYQVEGFNWLATLSSWQVGACLADDMGLGKTVQALATILLRAAEGPTLVIAPTSVLMNWTDEAHRFTPTLQVLSFGAGDRQKMLDQLQPFDLVVSSYGLLQTEGEKLAGVSWQTIVLDEAQAIKNMATKRSKAAMTLQAEFRIITTGTPIENHLGELWNLFQFINPGLLGSADSFNKQFAIPIEKYKNRQARGRLKKLIQPFILRRLKQDVLQELPPRTEMTLQVEMSQDEAAMYEAQRSQALEKIADVEASGSGQHMQILAEITRLRRFCCNPELVVPGCGLSSSKLKVFGNTVKELLDNGHKALVFSQFVGHLAILRKYLDDQKVSYQYLDGSTPVKKRKKRIRDFQSGTGDIFLISLKAGGAGLNLTAADYVIHMDPWWNPAVEDQASDRVHRIGQKRPVTVYRLVVKDTIEEKIIALHAHKRDLADNLLEGADMSGKVSTKQLLELMKG